MKKSRNIGCGARGLRQFEGTLGIKKPKKARTSRSGHHGRSERSERFPRHRGYVSAATHSLEAGSNFPAHKKRAKRAMDTGDMCRRRHIPSKPGAISRPIKKESASVTRRLFFAK
ncbi:MAG: hypothetical protein FWF77_02990 [Defluviitaleaceae bacterium]|nr:hypothetical protein [Defluviitaleaceae bacterium]